MDCGVQQPSSVSGSSSCTRDLASNSPGQTSENDALSLCNQGNIGRPTRFRFRRLRLLPVPDCLARRRKARSLDHESPSLVVQPGQERPVSPAETESPISRSRRKAPPSMLSPSLRPRYQFWVRANPVSARLDYALDRGPWQPIDMNQGTINTVNVAADGKPDLRFLAWKKVAELDLTRGRLVVRFRMYSAAQHHGAIDAFVFTTLPFVPRGTSHPDHGKSFRLESMAKPGRSFPERDTFRADAVFDLRLLNERVAGEHGFIRLSHDGNSFKTRRWHADPLLRALNTYVQRDRSAEDLAHHARFLAKRGVNLVRLHGHLESHEKEPRLTDADPKAIDEAWKLVAAMKKEGIYTSISPYWSVELKHVPASWGIEGWPENKSPAGLLFFNPKLQEGYKAWLRALLAPPNPYTGVPLSQDPALAMIHL